MLTVVIQLLILAVLVFMAWVLWDVKKALLKQESEIAKPRAVTLQLPAELGKSVHQIQQMLAHVIHTVTNMGSQMTNLNQVASNALQEVQAFHSEDNPHRIMIEVHAHPGLMPGDELPQEGRRMPMRPEDMPPEMREKFRTFHQIYQTLMQRGDLPSQQRPDLN